MGGIEGTEVDHNKVIAAAAKTHLSPIGMVRKGRSRTWLLDRYWWLGIVEFQPSSWARGTYLNVSLMWLWEPTDSLAFEVEPRRRGQFVEVGQDFGTQAARLASEAGEAITGLVARFDTVAKVIEYLEPRAVKSGARKLGHLATAYGLLGDMNRARQTFEQAVVARENEWSGPWRALSYLLDARDAAAEQSTFRNWVYGTVTATRAALKLPATGDALPGPS